MATRQIHDRTGTIGLGIFNLFSSGARTVMAIGIQEGHQRLVSAMKQGMFQPKFKANFPDNWINPQTIAETHPIFYVDRKGNLHFLKENRTEYARHIFQETFAGRFGLNMWRWRAYLRPPEAPQKVRKWAANKAREWARALTPRPAPALLSSRFHINTAHPATHKIRKTFTK